MSLYKNIIISDTNYENFVLHGFLYIYVDNVKDQALVVKKCYGDNLHVQFTMLGIESNAWVLNI